VTKGLRALGYEAGDSAGNFVMIPFTDAPGKSAGDADAHLLSHRIILRQLGAYNLPNALRMTIGLEDENRAVLDALRIFREA
jgi:histidinol-phosphate aminotransferase